jgi:hypothetical protein
MRKMPPFVVAVIFMSRSLGCARALRSFLFSLRVQFLTLKILKLARKTEKSAPSLGILNKESHNYPQSYRVVP